MKHPREKLKYFIVSIMFNKFAILKLKLNELKQIFKI